MPLSDATIRSAKPSIRPIKLYRCAVDCNDAFSRRQYRVQQL